MMLVVSSRERSIIASSDVAACFGDGEGVSHAVTSNQHVYHE